MISDFYQLSDKIRQLADLAQSLRRENAELRLSAVVLATENTDLSRRMDEAHRRISLLLEKMPVPVTEKTEESV